MTPGAKDQVDFPVRHRQSGRLLIFIALIAVTVAGCLKVRDEWLYQESLRSIYFGGRLIYLSIDHDYIPYRSEIDNAADTSFRFNIYFDTAVDSTFAGTSITFDQFLYSSSTDGDEMSLEPGTCLRWWDIPPIGDSTGRPCYRFRVSRHRPDTVWFRLALSVVDTATDSVWDSWSVNFTGILTKDAVSFYREFGRWD